MEHGDRAWYWIEVSGKVKAASTVFLYELATSWQDNTGILNVMANSGLYSLNTIVDLSSSTVRKFSGK
jgi:hypothetical protein